MGMSLIMSWLGWALAGLALLGSFYALLAAFLVGRFMRADHALPLNHPPVTILKPLHLGEPGLLDNLQSFFAQDYPGKVQIVFGVHNEADPAIDVVKALQARYPDRDTTIIANSAIYGANAKVSNLINMFPAARHDILVLSDSDIGVSRDWLSKVTGALEQPGIGLVTCLYTGECAEPPRLWSTLSAMGTSYEFLPNVIVGTSLGLAQPCMGSTIALTRTVLDEIGGFAAFADYLADDYEIGRAVREKGYATAIPALGVSHAAVERSSSELWHHELRWTRTIRMVSPLGHLGSVVTLAVPLALISAALLGFTQPALAMLGLALAARLFLKFRIDNIFGAYSGPVWLLPVRDVLSFAVFVTSLFGETVHWRGSRFSIEATGAMSQS
jgi:ceramide glucosyltransferase